MGHVGLRRTESLLPFRSKPTLASVRFEPSGPWPRRMPSGLLPVGAIGYTQRHSCSLRGLREVDPAGYAFVDREGSVPFSSWVGS
jgi:hypothetical protein